MIPLKSTLSKPSGFRDIEDRKSEVSIIGFVYGKYRDCWDRQGETLLCIYVDDQGAIDFSPHYQFHVSETTQ